MDSTFSTILIISLLLLLVRFSMSFTVIMSDSGAPPALVDGPQSGLTSSRSGAKTDPIEQEAVYDVMRATGNEWATEIPDVCRGRWHGIECMPDKDNVFHVVSLSFGALSDDTAFPTCDPTRSFISHSITRLPHLRTLFFYRCLPDNPQPIPSFLGLLGSNLQTLVLRENGHIGPIPYEIGNLTRLTILDLHRNNLNGSIPISLGRISGLSSLDLSGNRLSGSIPDVSFQRLSILDLNQNHLTGSIPTQLLSCDSLLKVDLSRNRISDPTPNLNGLKDLILLDLSYNIISNPFTYPFKNLNSLQALILNGNPSTATTIPEDAFEGLNSLMILGLSNMNLEGLIPESIDKLTELRVLHLNGNQLNGTIPPNLVNLNGLSELRLDNNRLEGPIPFTREMVWRMRRKLKLDNNLGLCFDAKSGLGIDLDTLSDAGIGHCETPEVGPTVTLQHMLKSNSKSSATMHKTTLLRSFLGLTAVFWFVLWIV
ncbi:LOW QUALITY PROTEIN: protein TOO MANY MOUTHS [Primulina eburnea]|uniref:LOW QUALITY PROTEIN: protein TOO MANY MOUTHS n=1 Tax=Primulina eburnea TaxID=1245227 RepID=UPI003C6BE681